jgi:hypothetical protein
MAFLVQFKNALNRASLSPDALSLDHDTSAITHTFLSTRFSSYCSYPLACRLRAHGHWPCQRCTRPPPRHSARPLALPGTARSFLQVVALGCQPYQVCRTAALSKSHGCAHPAARVANAFLPRRAATTVGLPPTSTVKPLPPVNTAHRRASILPSNEKMFA